MMVSINLRLKVIKENTRESDMIANMEKKKKNTLITPKEKKYF